MTDPIATQIRLRRTSRLLEVSFQDGSRFELPFEYLRVCSPSAEVKGHGPGQEVLVLGKEQVGITAVEPVGQYAVKLVFDDGHDTGLFTWKYLHELGSETATQEVGTLPRTPRCGRQPPVRGSPWGAFSRTQMKSGPDISARPASDKTPVTAGILCIGRCKLQPQKIHSRGTQEASGAPSSRMRSP